MFTLSATCIAIAQANKAGSLRLTTHVSRFGGTYVAISDDFGVIEVQDTIGDAQKRVVEVSQ